MCCDPNILFMKDRVLPLEGKGLGPLSEKTAGGALGIGFASTNFQQQAEETTTMIRPASETKPIRSLTVSPSQVVRCRAIRFNPSPIPLSYPLDGCESNLVVNREDGVVKSLEYHCKCGHTDKFICE